MSFQIGAVLASFAGLSALALLVLPPRQRRFGIIALLLGGVALFLTTRFSAPIYRIPGFSYVQFPWRFLGPAGMFLAAIAGLLASLAQLRRPGPVATLIVLASIVASVAFSGEHRTVSGRIPTSDQAHFEQKALHDRLIGPLTRAGEYLPAWAPDDDRVMIPVWPQPIARGARIEELRAGGSSMSFSIAAAGPAPTTVTVPWYFFPGWRVRVDARETAVGVDANGFLTFTVPPGDHRISVRFSGTTWDRATGWALGAASLGLLVMAAGRRRRHRD
jgi:hypothetical protein